MPALDEAGDLVQHERFGEGREVGDNKRNLQGSELLTLSRCDCNLDSRREKLHFHSTESIRPDILGPISHSTARLKMLRKWIHKVSRRFDIAALYSTTVGIKCTNPLIASSRLDGLTNPGVFELSPGELRLGFDGLRDEFTLLKMPIAESPHLDLFRRIDSGNDLHDSPYAVRLRSGTLDFRPPRRVGEKHLTARREKFFEVRQRIQAGDYEPIKIIVVRGDHFTVDGKHRAAVCALLGRQVRCLDASAAVHDSFYSWVCRKMEKTPAQFQKHICWFDAIYRRHRLRDAKQLCTTPL
ncbi:MAG TPA: hypothetical protein VFT34_00845 [Verrucomicrobiae bacterium]|nr:hypothetical protein [Verrucomicrobiae bacterium]